jgi:hypothetical protein
MRTPSKLIASVLIAAGVSQDIGIAAGLTKDDGMDHTVPRVPVMVGIAGATTTTSVSIATLGFVANNMTGEEIAVPPADKYIYIVGIATGKRDRIS